MRFRKLSHIIWKLRQALKIFFAKRNEAVYMPFDSCIECQHEGIWINSPEPYMRSSYCSQCDQHWTIDTYLNFKTHLVEGLPPNVKRLK